MDVKYCFNGLTITLYFLKGWWKEVPTFFRSPNIISKVVLMFGKLHESPKKKEEKK